ncbi:hypothetical protein BC835DRAFT_1417416 [Cytidiella melzeri]|nr:hypothetical protein BC835DRAFT_1417416 [Cytidiella melzeri]
MSSFSTLLRPLPAVRRAYSVYTKAGGGRFFNAAKSLAQTNSTSKTEVDASATTNSGDSSNPSSVVEDANITPPNAETKSPFTSSPLSINFAPLPIHPTINPQDLRLHQFFSLYRPLLTLSQPASSVFESPSAPFSYSPSPDAEATRHGAVDEPPEASPESDADAARILAKALVSSRVEAALAWEGTLKRLGLDESKVHAAEVSQAQAEFDVYMDSTRRKRRKKMKKHKLKKRRRLTRMQKDSRS